MNQLLIHELEQNLGQSKHTSNSNYAFTCPKCKQLNQLHQYKKKLEIDIISQRFNCWICGFKGKSLSSLYKSLKLDTSNLEKFVTINQKEIVTTLPQISLPNEFKLMIDVPNKKFKQYLDKRGIDEIDWYKYQIGYCETGWYKNRIIVPSFDTYGNVNNFTARTILDDKFTWNYLKPKGVGEDNIINFEILINWNKPVILCEGSFDAIAIGDNAVPLFGKNISSKLLENLLGDAVERIYLCLDKDALKSSIRIIQNLRSFGKKVYFVELDDKDPSEIGKQNMKQIIADTKLIDMKKILELKFKI
jgi:DNA primase